MVGVVLLEVAVFLMLSHRRVNGIMLDVSVCGDQAPQLTPKLPYFLGGAPQPEQEHVYIEKQAAKHTADGEGLSQAKVGKLASFTIRLQEDSEGPAMESWNVQDGVFFYVWIAGQDQIFIAEVVNNRDGTLNATYESVFPGEYLVYVEAVVIENHDEGMPVEGSPFSLTITGDPAINIDALPTCGAEGRDVADYFWNTGPWVSSNVASAKHGVTRDGWVFQPKTCVHDTFSYDDLTLLASLSEPTWMLVLGGSVQRGIYLTLVDMILAQGQKDNFGTSAIQKCWGYADITVGSLRVTYQDMRLWTVDRKVESVECNNAKLVSGSTTAYIRSARDFLKSTVFQEGQPWPAVIAAPLFLRDDDQSPNCPIEVLMKALPETWLGTLFMMEHMSGLGFHWHMKNPTRAALDEVGLMYHNVVPTEDNGFGKMETYHQLDPRVQFMSMFPLYQAKLFENERTKDGKRIYGASQHFHYIANLGEPAAYSGAKMVISSITEMISHIVIAIATGGKTALYKKVASTPDICQQSSAIRRSFQICTDCPASLVPFHVKPAPNAFCQTVPFLPGNASKGEVWDNELCPDWCMATKPVDQTPTGSGMVDVRVCDAKDAH